MTATCIFVNFFNSSIIKSSKNANTVLALIRAARVYPRYRYGYAVTIDNVIITGNVITNNCAVAAALYW